MSYLDELCKYLNLSSVKTGYIDSRHIQEVLTESEMDAKSNEINQCELSKSVESYNANNVDNKNSNFDWRDTHSNTNNDVRENSHRVNISSESGETIEIKKSEELNSTANKTVNININEQKKIHNSHTAEIDKNVENNFHEFNKTQNTSINKHSINHNNINETRQVTDEKNQSDIPVKSEESVTAPKFDKVNRSGLNVKNTTVNENTKSLTGIYNDYVKNHQTTNNKIINKSESDNPQVKIGQINVIVNDRSLTKAKKNKEAENTLTKNEFGLRGL